MTTRAAVVAVALALLGGRGAAAADGNLTTYSGYLVDLYCYGLGRAGGLALDGADVIREPETHTLHCLRDPPQCYEGGFMLAVNRNNGTGARDYHIKFQLDDVSNQNALALLRTYPVGHPRDHEGNFWVTANGTHRGDGILRGATVVECVGNSETCDGACSGSCDPPEIVPALTVSRFLWGHVICMVLSWGCLLPLGVLWARNMKWSKTKICGEIVWFQGHRTLQIVGWSLQLAGFAFIIAHKTQGGGALTKHFSDPHEVIGLCVVILGTLQPLNAQLRFLPGVGHPEPDGSRTARRRAWEYLHKGCGYAAVGFGCLNVILGIIKANNTGFGNGLVPIVGTIAGLSLGSLLLALIALELVPALLRRAAGGSKVRTVEVKGDSAEA